MSKRKKHLSKKQRMRRRRKRILIAEIIILVILLGGLFAWFKLGKINWDDIDVSNIQTNELSVETQEVLKGYKTFAIFGVDNRTIGNYDTGNSDSVMVCSINNDTKEVKIMSIYRDTYLDVGGGSFRKCNAAYANGGAEGAIAMINTNLDLNIQEYVAVDFEAVIESVDAVGGVEIDVQPEEVQILNAYVDDNARITKHDSTKISSSGLQTLNGIQALAYCRIRYTAGDDFRRAERQRTVISKLVEKAKKANIMQLNSLVDAIFPKVSTSLSAKDALAMATDLRDYDIVATSGWPIDMRTADLGSKGSVIVPCTLESNVRKSYEFLYDDYTHMPSDDVRKKSETIKSSTGYDESSSVDYMNW